MEKDWWVLRGKGQIVSVAFIGAAALYQLEVDNISTDSIVSLEYN